MVVEAMMTEKRTLDCQSVIEQHSFRKTHVKTVPILSTSPR